MGKKLLLVGLCAILVGLVSFALLFTQFLRLVSPEESTLRDNSVSFLTSIVGFNLTEYKIMNSHYVSSSCLVGGNGLPLATMSYDLQSSENIVHADLNYVNKNNSYTLDSFLYTYLGSTAFVYMPYPSDNLLYWTRGFLERYQSFQNDKPYISEIRKTLDTVNCLEPLNVTCGNTKLQITIRQFTETEIYTSLTFLNASEGIDYTSKSVVFNFHNGLSVNFADHWNQSKLGI